MLCTRPSAESARHLIPYYVSIGGDRAALITKHAITLSALTNTHTRTLQPPRDVQVSRSLRRYMHIMCARCGAKHTMNLNSSSSTRGARPSSSLDLFSSILLLRTRSNSSLYNRQFACRRAPSDIMSLCVTTAVWSHMLLCFTCTYEGCYNI